MENDIQILERTKFIRNGFDRIKIEEIDFYFNQKFSTWIYSESDTKELLTDNRHLNFDKEGKLIERSYSGTKEGFELTEKYFIGKELILLDKVKYDLLNLKNRMQLTFYKEYLNKRNSGTIIKVEKIPIPQIALQYFYEDIFINRENANKYLEGTGHTSGDKLYNEYIKWTDKQNRKADPESKTKLKNKIKLFENVIDLLPENKKGKAIDELKILNSFISKYQ